MSHGSNSSSRRRFAIASASAAVALGLGAPLRVEAASAAVCVLTPEEEEGPFYIPSEHVRSAIAEGRAGVPLALHLRVVDAENCAPLAQAAVDIWQCDALGVYSGYAGAMDGPGGPPPGGPPPGGPPPDGPPKARPTTDETFLRGIQVTGAKGTVTFATIFPGFYEGRVNHIHVKVRHRTTLHTGQIFFPEALARAISSQAPYVRHHIERTTLDQDHVFTGQSGRSAMAVIARAGGDAGKGYRASLTLAVSTQS